MEVSRENKRKVHMKCVDLARLREMNKKHELDDVQNFSNKHSVLISDQKNTEFMAEEAEEDLPVPFNTRPLKNDTSENLEIGTENDPKNTAAGQKIANKDEVRQFLVGEGKEELPAPDAKEPAPLVASKGEILSAVTDKDEEFDEQYLELFKKYFDKLSEKCKSLSEFQKKNFEYERSKIDEFFAKICYEIDEHFVLRCEELLQLFKSSQRDSDKFLFLFREFCFKVFVDIRKRVRSGKIVIVSSKGLLRGHCELRVMLVRRSRGHFPVHHTAQVSDTGAEKHQAKRFRELLRLLRRVGVFSQDSTRTRKSRKILR